jgi:predicted PhzF superfamily epimerase YddE/YHI9
MLAIASRFAFSETAVVRTGDGEYQLRGSLRQARWRSADTRTLAAAARFLGARRRHSGKAIHFDTLSGTLTARDQHGRDHDRAAEDGSLIATTLPTGYADALGIDALRASKPPMRGGHRGIGIISFRSLRDRGQAIGFLTIAHSPAREQA